MGIRKYKPTTPGRRGASVSDFAEITRSTRRSRWFARCTARADVTPTAGSPPGTRAVATSAPTG